MRAEGGHIPWLERHLDRMMSSAAALGLTGIASRGTVRTEVRRTLAGRAPTPWRVRAIATRDGSVVVDVDPIGASPAPTAITQRGAWDPSEGVREHKTTRYDALRSAAAEARAGGVGHALLLDRSGRLGEAATANVVVRIDGRDRTPPVEGILSGVARAKILESLAVEVVHIREGEWRRASEIVLVNALRGAMPLLEIDGSVVGVGRAGPLARTLEAVLDEDRGATGDMRSERAVDLPGDPG